MILASSENRTKWMGTPSCIQKIKGIRHMHKAYLTVLRLENLVGTRVLQCGEPPQLKDATSHGEEIAGGCIIPAHHELPFWTDILLVHRPRGVTSSDLISLPLASITCCSLT